MSEDLVAELRSFGEAYPVEIFPEVTDAERQAHPGLITRTSASMGRHVGQWTVRAADRIEALERENAALRGALKKAVGVLSGEDMNKAALIDALTGGRELLAKRGSDA